MVESQHAVTNSEEKPQAITEEISSNGVVHKERALIYDDHDDPHTAAFYEEDVKLTPSVWAAVFFLGLTFEAAIGFSFSGVVAILVPIALDLEGNTLNISWIPSGWAVASSVSFAIAGQFSDIFGRRYVMLFGQLLVVLGHVPPSISQTDSADHRRHSSRPWYSHRCIYNRRLRNRRHLCLGMNFMMTLTLVCWYF